GAKCRSAQGRWLRRVRAGARHDRALPALAAFAARSGCAGCAPAWVGHRPWPSWLAAFHGEPAGDRVVEIERAARYDVAGAADRDPRFLRRWRFSVSRTGFVGKDHLELGEVDLCLLARRGLEAHLEPCVGDGRTSRRKSVT